MDHGLGDPVSLPPSRRIHFLDLNALRSMGQANTLMMPSQKAGRSSGLREVTSLPSITTVSSTHSAPAFVRSFLSEGQEVSLCPLAIPASIRVQGP